MANSLAALLGPIGGLAMCGCCGIITAVWGLFATTIALAVFTKKWVDAVKTANGVGGGAAEMIFNQTLLIAVLCMYGLIGLRRALRSAD